VGIVRNPPSRWLCQSALDKSFNLRLPLILVCLVLRVQSSMLLAVAEKLHQTVESASAFAHQDHVMSVMFSPRRMIIQALSWFFIHATSVFTISLPGSFSRGIHVFPREFRPRQHCCTLQNSYITAHLEHWQSRLPTPLCTKDQSIVPILLHKTTLPTALNQDSRISSNHSYLSPCITPILIDAGLTRIHSNGSSHRVGRKLTCQPRFRVLLDNHHILSSCFFHYKL